MSRLESQSQIPAGQQQAMAQIVGSHYHYRMGFLAVVNIWEVNQQTGDLSQLLLKEYQWQKMVYGKIILWRMKFLDTVWQESNLIKREEIVKQNWLVYEKVGIMIIPPGVVIQRSICDVIEDEYIFSAHH